LREEAVRANRAYELIVSRGGLEPAFLADDGRHDRVEVVSIDDGEVALFWNLPVKLAVRLVRELRADLIEMQAEEFFDKWVGADAEDLF
jgi:hypothetical protein